MLISTVQQRAMGSGKPYRSFAWLKQSLLHGKLPLWAFFAVTGFLLLLLVSARPRIAAGADLPASCYSAEAPIRPQVLHKAGHAWCITPSFAIDAGQPRTSTASRTGAGPCLACQL